MWKKFLFSSCLFIFFGTSPVFASRSLIISNDKATLSNDEVLTINASASGFTADEQIRIKGAFFKEGSTNYFGYTQKNNDWIKNSQSTVDQLQVQIGQWDGLLRLKSDFSDTGFTGNGDYKLKIGFYYLSGADWSSVQWSDNILTINLKQPDPTATPTPGPTNTPTPAPTSTPAPTAVPSATPKPLPTPTRGAVIPTIGEQEFVNAKQNSQGQLLDLGESPPPSNTPSVLGETTSKSDPVLPILIISVGAIGLVVSLVLLFFHSRKSVQNSEVVN